VFTNSSFPTCSGGTYTISYNQTNVIGYWDGSKGANANTGYSLSPPSLIGVCPPLQWTSQLQ
jgi:hypothetical protein